MCDPKLIPVSGGSPSTGRITLNEAGTAPVSQEQAAINFQKMMEAGPGEFGAQGQWQAKAGREKEFYETMGKTSGIYSVFGNNPNAYQVSGVSSYDEAVKAVAEKEGGWMVTTRSGEKTFYSGRPGEKNPFKSLVEAQSSFNLYDAELRGETTVNISKAVNIKPDLETPSTVPFLGSTDPVVKKAVSDAIERQRQILAQKFGQSATRITGPLGLTGVAPLAKATLIGA